MGTFVKRDRIRPLPARAIAVTVIVIGIALGTLRRSVRHGAVAGFGAFLALCGELVILVLDVGSKSQ
jgi:hypothetical protein